MNLDHFKPMRRSLQECVKTTPIIGVCRCRVVERINGLRFARVVVEKPLKGCRARQELVYLTERIYGCDSTDNFAANAGERTLLFLYVLTENPYGQGENAPENIRVNARRYETTRDRYFRGIPLHRTISFGNGRMPIKSWGQGEYVTRASTIQFPENIPAVSDPKNGNRGIVRYAPLPPVLVCIEKYLRESKPAKERP